MRICAVLMWVVMGGLMAAAQGPAGAAGAAGSHAPDAGASATAGVGRKAFEVVSIRPGKDSIVIMSWATSPTGYLTTQSLRYTILMAYFPTGGPAWSPNPLRNAPSWIDDRYEINAKVAEEDLAAWRAQGMALDQKPLLQEMLQSMLAERCKLAVHSVPTEIDGYALVVGKRGPQMTLSKEGAALPQGMLLPDGGVVVGYKRGEPARGDYYSASMDDFARNLTRLARRPVVNRTGLGGKYDFTLRWADVDPEHPEREGVTQFDDPDPIKHWDVESLGLTLQPIKIPSQMLVIDHIERPSEN